MFYKLSFNLGLMFSWLTWRYEFWGGIKWRWSALFIVLYQGMLALICLFCRIGHFICIKNLFRQTSFLLNDICNASGNSSAASVDRSCFSCYLDVLKPNYFLKLSNHLLLELNSPALEPSPSFCFKLSYNNFDFSLITLGPIRMSFLEPSCAQIKAVLSMR